MPRLRAGALPAVMIAGVLMLSACGSDSDTYTATSASTTGGASTTASSEPIVIGAAVDNSNFMKPVDQPPLAAAKLQAEKINAAGGVDGRKIEFKTINTQIDPEKTKSAATQLIDDGADILWVTCDVDLSTPSIQVGLQKKVLTVAPCIGSDQMGPKRFGDAGKLAFSFGNVAQDEGAAMAQTAINNGWKTANVIADKALVYTRNVCQAFEVKFEDMGGKVVGQETFTQGDNTINGVVSKVNNSQADVDVLCTTTGKDLPAFMTGLRGLGNNTPVLGPWSIDGTYWLPKSPSVSDNIHYVTYASIFGDDPDPKIRQLVDDLKQAGAPPAKGGFTTGVEALDSIVHAIEENGGDTDGEKLAASLEKMNGFQTTLGKISFSPGWHSVFGREYRVIGVTKRKPKLEGTVTAEAPVQLPS